MCEYNPYSPSLGTLTLSLVLRDRGKFWMMCWAISLCPARMAMWRGDRPYTSLASARFLLSRAFSTSLSTPVDTALKTLLTRSWRKNECSSVRVLNNNKYLFQTLSLLKCKESDKGTCACAHAHTHTHSVVCTRVYLCTWLDRFYFSSSGRAFGQWTHEDHPAWYSIFVWLCKLEVKSL